jgi:ribosomal protein S18 acetylase RimI-like enzyme
MPMTETEPFWVRTATPADVPRIAALQLRAWQETYGALVPQAVIDSFSVQRRAEQWQRHLVSEDDLARLELVEDAAGRLVGFGATAAPQEGALGWDAELVALYLLDEAKRRGLGRRLLVPLLAHVADAGSSSVGFWVLCQNLAARAFYAHLGAIEVGERVETLAGRALVETAMMLDAAAIERLLDRDRRSRPAPP